MVETRQSVEKASTFHPKCVCVCGGRSILIKFSAIWWHLNMNNCTKSSGRFIMYSLQSTSIFVQNRFHDYLPQNTGGRRFI